MCFHVSIKVCDAWQIGQEMCMHLHNGGHHITGIPLMLMTLLNMPNIHAETLTHYQERVS